jgi:hypothetical protein
MRGKSFIQWGLLGCIVLMLMLLQAIHLHVGWYNLFLVLLISLAFFVILCTRMLERRGLSRKEGDGQDEHEPR